MKKLLPILSIAIVMAACNQTPKINSANTQSPVAQNTITADTAGLANFQLWKAQNELADMNQYNQPVQAAPQAAKQVVVYRDAPVRKTSTSKKSSSGSGNSGVSNDSGSGESTSSTGSNEAKAPAKKGISKAAKGAIIGGVAGGVAGAVINKKNRGAGAVIGAVIGAGGGYVIGRGQDKKDGRVTRSSTPPFSIPTGILQK